MSGQNHGQKPPGYPPGFPPGAPAGMPPAAPPSGGPPAPAQQPGPYPFGMSPRMGGPDVSKPKYETLAVISLVAGIAAILCIFPGCCCYLSFLAPAPGIAAIVLGIMSRKKIEQDPLNLTGSVLALTGMICGGVATALFLIFIILYILGIAGQVISDLSHQVRR
jgi:hypothetical protein